MNNQPAVIQSAFEFEKHFLETNAAFKSCQNYCNYKLSAHEWPNRSDKKNEQKVGFSEHNGFVRMKDFTFVQSDVIVYPVLCLKLGPVIFTFELLGHGHGQFHNLLSVFVVRTLFCKDVPQLERKI